MSAKLVKKNRFLPLIGFPFHFFIVFCTKTEGLVVLLQRNNEACMMKTKPIAIMLLATLMAGCTEDVERQAQPYLERAEQSYTTKQYSLAKLQLDSIKLLYPKAFETRKRAQQLHFDVLLLMFSYKRYAQQHTQLLRESILCSHFTSRNFS